MLKLKKILPVVFAAALVLAGCGSDSSPETGTTGGSDDAGSFIEESVDAGLSADEGEDTELQEEDQQADDGSADEQTSENTDKTSETQSASSSDTSSKQNTDSSSSSEKTTTSTTTTTSKQAVSSSAGTSSSETQAAEPTYKYKDGTYSGSADGFNGPIGVSVTISKDKITSVSVTSGTDDDPYFTQAKALCSKIVSANSADVDGVSGATYSSNGIKGAVKAALAKAKN